MGAAAGSATAAVVRSLDSASAYTETKTANGNGNGSPSAATATAFAPTATGGASPSPSAIAQALMRTSDARSIWSETTNLPSLHAVGDVLSGCPELTPVAIRAGRLLARRIMQKVLPVEGEDSDATVTAEDTATGSGSAALSDPLALAMDYGTVPTTVFTPMEYGCVGLSEEAAEAVYGSEGIEVYHAAYDTLELSVAHRLDANGMPLPPHCYCKVITTREPRQPEHASASTPSAARQRVIGMHVLGPHAGEVVQGFATAMKLGLTKGDLDATVGIHPTHAEEFVGLEKTKRSGVSYTKTSC